MEQTIEEKAQNIKSQYYKLGGSTSYLAKESALVEIENRRLLLLEIYEKVRSCRSIDQALSIIERIGLENNELKKHVK